MYQRCCALALLAGLVGLAPSTAMAQSLSGRPTATGFSASRLADRYSLTRDGAENHSIANLLTHDAERRSSRSGYSSDGRKTQAGVRGAGRGFYNHKPIPTPPIHLHPTQRSLNTIR